MKPTLTTTRRDTVLELAARAFEIDQASLLDSSRTGPAPLARQAVYLALYNATSGSYSDVAKALGKNHSTVSYGVEQAQLRCQNDSDYAAIVQRLRDAISWQVTPRPAEVLYAV